MNTIQELSSFNHACDDFVNGKYLLIDTKINSILNLINENEKLKNIVNSCLVDFDFNNEFKKIFQSDDHSTLFPPQDEQYIVAFVYNLFYKFTSGQIDSYKFLTQYFNVENATAKETNNFAKTIVIPFKNAVNDIYSKRHILVESNDYQSNIYNKIMLTIRLILKNLDAYKLNMNQKEEFTMLLNSLFIASEKNDKKLVYSLMIGLDYFSKYNKKSRVAYLSLEECFENN